MKTRVFDIVRSSAVDGPGIRTTVFFQGCNLRCQWCHNPESWLEANRLMVYESRCVHCGACAVSCPQGAIAPDGTTDRTMCIGCGKCTGACLNHARKKTGYWTDTDDLLRVVEKDRVFYELSNGGVTVSGGECMLQADALYELLCRAHEKHINTAVDTAGNVDWSVFDRVLPYTDWFLYDIKCIDPALHTGLTGVSNERIIDNYQHLLSIGSEKIIVRVPVIPEYNTQNGEMEKIIVFLRKNRPHDVEFLPYHRLGEGKSIALGEAAFTTLPPSQEMIDNLNKMYRA